MKQEYGTLTKTAALFATANIGGKLLKLLIIPLYTYYMTTYQFGLAETVSVTASLLCPVLLLGTNEAAIRFSMDRIHTAEDTASNCFAIVLVFSIPVLIICLILGRLEAFEGRALLLYLIVISGAVEALMMSLAKGMNRNGLFAASEIVAAVVLVVSNIIALAVIRAGIEGYLWSLALSSAVRCVFIESRLKIFRKLRPGSVSRKSLTDILKFSLPLMPNALLWWVMDSSDRYIILWVLGASSVGIYTIACRLYAAFTGLAVIFHQAWQLSAIRQYFSEDYNEFYSKVSGVFTSAFFAAAALIIPFVRPLVGLLDNNFSDAWKYSPLLLIAAVFASLSGFAGVNYTASGKTKGALTTTAAGAAVNIALSIVLAHAVGIQGVVIATLAAYYVLWILRLLDVKKELGKAFGIKLAHVNLLILLAESGCILMNAGWYTSVICIIILAFVNRKSFSDILSVIMWTTGYTTK